MNIIVWDLGATKCAAALVQFTPGNTQNLKREQFSIQKKAVALLKSARSLAELTENIEAQLEYKIADAAAIIIGAAGMFDGEILHLEAGYPYAMPLGTLAKNLGWTNYQVVHDYIPIVCGTFIADFNHPSQIKKLHPAPLNIYGRRVAMGLGTGLGLKDGVLLASGDFWLGHNEMGHIGITHPPASDLVRFKRHQDLLKFLYSDRILLRADEPLTFEQILSGKGLVRLHQFMYPETAKTSGIPTPEIVGELLKAKKAPETLGLFAWYLGLFVGTVQLTFMPEGGLWMTGGVLSHHLEVFEHAEFWQGLEASPAYLLQRRHFPLAAICDPDHAFLGGAYYAARRMKPLADRLQR